MNRAEYIFIDDEPGRVDAFHSVAPAEAISRLERHRRESGMGGWLSVGPENYSAELFEAAKSAGACGVLLETMRGMEDLEKGSRLAKAAGISFIASATPRAGEACMLSGESLREFAAKAISAGVTAVGLNCTTPAEMLKAARVLEQCGAKRLYLSPSAGVPCPDYPLSAAEWATQFAELLRSLSFSGEILTAGCCGTDAHYLRNLKDQIQTKNGKENHNHT